MGHGIAGVLEIKHSRSDRGYIIVRKEGGRVGGIVCALTPNGMDVYVTNARHDVWMAMEIDQGAAGSVSFLAPVGPITGRRGNFKLLGRLARSTGTRGNKFVFQPISQHDVIIAIGSALSRSFVVRRCGKEVAEIVKGTKSVTISIGQQLATWEEGIVIGIAIATCMVNELKGHLKEDARLPKVLVV